MDEVAGLPGVVDRYHVRLDQRSGRLSLPYTLDRLIELTLDGVPLTIVSPWYEFVAYGPGIQDDYDDRGRCRYNWFGIGVVTDRGEEPVRTIIPDEEDSLDGPWVLRVYASVNEDVDGVPPVINLQGLDTDGLIIRTLSDGTADTYYNGVDVPIDFGVPYTQTTQEFSKITGVVKPETRGYVKLTAWNGTVEVELSNYAFNETAPSYRHYYVPRLRNRNFGSNGCCHDRVVLARCHKRFVPVKEDNDLLIISNINALKCMFIAQWKRDSGDYDAYLIQKQQAVDILKKEALGYLGKARTPAISFSRGFPIGSSLPFVR